MYLVSPEPTEGRGGDKNHAGKKGKKISKT